MPERNPLNETQRELLHMLKEFEDICREHGINYTLAGGTLIGAVRHGGFLPWDDDLDVYMTRDNWEKLLDVYLAGEFPENRIIECPETDAGYCNMFPRYIRTDTTSVHSNQIAHDDPAGMVLDIFVMDPMNYTEEKYDRYVRDLMLYSDLLNIKIGFSTRYGMNRWRYPAYVLAEKIVSRRRLLRRLEKRMAGRLDEGGRNCIMRWGGSPFVLDAEIFDGYRYIQFEDIQVQIATHYLLYLNWQYGDEWVYFPPHADRDGHEAVINTRVGYEVLRDDYKKLIDQKRLRKLYIHRKIKYLFTNRIHYRKNDETLRAKAVLAKMELQRKLDEAGDDVFEQFEKKEYGKLREIFDGFIRTQLSADYIGRVDRIGKVYRMLNPCIIDIDTKYMELMAELLIRTERMAQAYRLLNLYAQKGSPTEKMQELLGEIEDIRAVSLEYSLGRTEEAFERSGELREKYPGSDQNMRIRLRLILEEEDRFRRYVDEADALLTMLDEMKPGDGEIAKYKGDMDRRLGGNRSEAYYRYALEHTRNGIVVLEAKRILDGNDKQRSN